MILFRYSNILSVFFSLSSVLPMIIMFVIISSKVFGNKAIVFIPSFSNNVIDSILISF